MHLRTRLTQFGMCACLLIGSAVGAGWKWEAPFLLH